MEKIIMTWAYSTIDNHMKYVDSVPNGYNCGCVCTCCGKPLNARQGEVNEHSFAHRKEDGECGWGPESSLHSLAKQIIADNKKVMVPPCGGIFSGRLLEFVKVETEIRKFRKDQQPDVIGVDENGKEWCIEISYTNPLNEDRKKKYINDKRYCLEIDISDICIEQDEEASELKAFLLERKDNREWIYPIHESEFKQIDKPEKPYIYHNTEQLNEYGLSVNDVPSSIEDSNPIHSTAQYGKLLEEAFRKKEHNHDFQYDKVIPAVSSESILPRLASICFRSPFR